MADLVVRGARQHNLKNLTIRLPRDRLVVITGPSGSGKSSLAFDTIYAEAQRRYVESLSVYARQFLGQMPKPDVDGIDGLSPAISVRQQGTSRNPRSTVGTLTEIYDYLRLLYARLGTAHSPRTGKEMRAFSVEQVVDRALSLPAETRLTIAAPLPDADDAALELQLARLRKEGFVRVAIDGVVRDLGEELARLPKGSHKLEVHVDRVRVKPSSRQRVSEAVELAYRQTGGFVRLFTPDGFDWLGSERLVCLETGESYGELTPRTFSFNSPEGACPACGGLGVGHEFDAELVVPDPTLSIQEGAIAAWGRREGAFYQRELESLSAALEVDLDKPWEKLPQAVLKRILSGAPARKRTSERGATEPVAWPGVLPALKERSAQLARKKRGANDQLTDVLVYLEDDAYRFAREVVCSECEGARLSPLARNVRVRGVTLPSLSELSLRELLGFFQGFDAEDARSEVLQRLLKDITSRVSALVDLGLDYLALSRRVTTLSGGEIERIRLATQIGSGLVGVLYVLDEPSAGLHARDNERLIASLHRLRDQGNSLVVVEHDEATIRAADYVVDLGPGAGVRGGLLMAAGTPLELAAHADSPTGAFLSGRVTIERRLPRPLATHWLELDDVATHNLKHVSIRLPVGRLSCITGVSGSGKSSLIIDSLLPMVKAQLHRRAPEPLSSTLRGAEVFDRVIDVDQAPIGRTPRSSPASYVGAFDDLRELFATLPEARARGFGAARFSFNVKGGRCELCRGDGVVRVDMQFLPDVFVRCETCQGRRYNRETLEVRYRGYSVADVLEMSVEEALALFAPVPKLTTKLGALKDVGLGYVALGQPANTLSGGEAQRIKLARELARRATGKTLLVLDEPTTGLHFGDVAVLIDLLERLVDLGNTVIVIEHHLELAKVADFVLDLGPEGGPEGGEVIAQGTPEEVAAEPRSYTGQYLKALLAKTPPPRR
ncbi:MAG: excinuclease subunit UvrA [Myxococcaceae bacterium]|nr:excinuclease subunit UvrA [Myxococcaceae bacterium]